MEEPALTAYQVSANDKRLVLIRTIDPNEELLGELKSRCRDFRQHIDDSMRSVASTNVKAGRLLDLLIVNTHNTAIHEVFLTALRNYDQEHVANVITGAQDGKQPLKEETYQLLQQKSAILYQLINPVNDLLPQLLSRLVFGDNDVQRVRDARYLNAMAEELVSIVKRKSNCSFGKFLQALVSSRQEHVVHVLTDGQEGLSPLSDKMVRAVTRARSSVVNALDPWNSGLLTELVSVEVFVQCEIEFIEKIRNESPDLKSVNGMIIDLMLRKPKQLYDEFWDALKRTGHQHVIQAIEKGVVAYELKPVSSCEATQETVSREVEDDVVSEIVPDLGAMLAEHGLQADVVRNCIKLRFSGLTLEQVDKLEELVKSGWLKNQLLAKCQTALAKHNYQTISLQCEPGEIERVRENFKKYALMTSDHREAILSSVDRLVKDMVISPRLLDALPTMDHIRRRAVEGIASKEDQVRTLLQIVSRLPDPAFDELVDALRATGQHGAVRIILDRATGDKQDKGPSNSRSGSIYGAWGGDERIHGKGSGCAPHDGSQKTSGPTDCWTPAGNGPGQRTTRENFGEPEIITGSDVVSNDVAFRCLRAAHRAELARMADDYCDRLQTAQNIHMVQLQELSTQHAVNMNTALASYKAATSLSQSHAAVQQDLMEQVKACKEQLNQQTTALKTMEDNLQRKFEQRIQDYERAAEERFNSLLAEEVARLQSQIDRMQSELNENKKQSEQVRRFVENQERNNPSLSKITPTYKLEPNMPSDIMNSFESIRDEVVRNDEVYSKQSSAASNLILMYSTFTKTIARIGLTHGEWRSISPQVVSQQNLHYVD